jgi:hypothetical protein
MLQLEIYDYSLRGVWSIYSLPMSAAIGLSFFHGSQISSTFNILICPRAGGTEPDETYFGRGRSSPQFRNAELEALMCRVSEIVFLFTDVPI